MKKGLKIKLITVAIMLILIPLITSSVGSYMTARSIISSSLEELSKSTLDGVESALDIYLKGYEESMNTLPENMNLKHILEHPEYQPFTMHFLGTFADAHEDVLTVTLATKDKKTYEYPDRSIPLNHDLTQKTWYKETVEKKTLVWSEPYIDGYTGKTIVSASTPVYNKDSLVGVVLIDITLDTLSEVMNEFKIGKDGAVYLIDANGKTMAHGDKQYIGKEHSSEEVKKLIKTQKEGYIEYVDSDNISRIGMFKTLGTTNWKIFGDMNTSEVESRTYSMIINAGIVALIVLGIAIPLSYKGAMKLLGYINSLLNDMKRMQEGDFTVRSNIKSEDEFEILSQSFNSTLSSLTILIKNIQDIAVKVKGDSENLAATAEETSATAEEVMHNVNEIAKGAYEQATEVESGVNLATSLSVKMNELTDNMQDMQESTKDVVQSNLEGLKMIETLKEKTNKNNATTYNVEQAVLELDRQSKHIGTILNTITSIANQTNLLALNASIEAARAGEHGKGFAVVADEIRHLAQESKDATDEIQSIIKNIQDNTVNTVEIMHDLKNVTKEQDEAVGHVNGSFETISSAIQVINQKIDLMSHFINEIGKEKDEIVESIESISTVANQTSAAAQEVNASMEQQAMAVEEFANAANSLNELALILRDETAQFKI